MTGHRRGGEGPAIGRREAHKRATRQALLDAADRLFHERGVPQTTVRDIAEAAGVTERTFFRYFRTKEDLIIRDAFAWMPAFQQAILARPAGEPPLLAVRRALESLMAAITRIDAASPPTLFAAGAPADRRGLSALGVMRKLETDLADVLEQRLAREAQPDHDQAVVRRFGAEVLARTAVAAFRTAMLHDSHLRSARTRRT
ncbi:TetR/AcrR family transcriptional regulator [Geodermatophilus amargosae]|uniref:TetR/AcrR family transcriptional regulator n=1 Tax=Geodermatophilus amargosae TaxID=1296565 RepID=UPI0034DE9583